MLHFSCFLSIVLRVRLQGCLLFFSPNLEIHLPGQAVTAFHFVTNRPVSQKTTSACRAANTIIANLGQTVDAELSDHTPSYRWKLAASSHHPSKAPSFSFSWRSRACTILVLPLLYQISYQAQVSIESQLSSIDIAPLSTAFP